MLFKKEKNYKLVELAGALVICDVDQRVKDLTAKPLIVADAGRLLTYLDRYFFEREKGTPFRDAHDLALKTAQITTIIPGPCSAKPKLDG